MDTTAIRVEKLSKMYRIGAKESQPQTLIETLRRAAASPLDYLRSTLRPPREEEIFWALRDVSFEVKHGDVVGIIGRNGAGKSTLLKILSRITEPTGGRAIINGRVSSLLEVGTGFHPELTGRENIFLNGAIMGMRSNEIQRKFDEIVDFSGVEQFIDTPVKRYSSGMYVRLAFAVAAHLEPDILIIDEVLAVGDATFQKKCLGKIENVNKGQGRTVLFVSHNMGAIRQLCSVGILLANSQIAALGSIDKVIDAYLQTMAELRPHGGAYIACNDALGLALRKVDILNEKGIEAAALQTGMPGAIRLCMETAKPQKDMLVSIAVNTLDDVRVCIFHSKISSTSSIDIHPPAALLLCELPKVPFLPGVYRIHIKIAVANGEVAFYVPYAAEIPVEGGDFFGTGKLPDNAWAGANLVEHTWRVKAA